MFPSSAGWSAFAFFRVIEKYKLFFSNIVFFRDIPGKAFRVSPDTLFDQFYRSCVTGLAVIFKGLFLARGQLKLNGPEFDAFSFSHPDDRIGS